MDTTHRAGGKGNVTWRTFHPIGHLSSAFCCSTVDINILVLSEKYGWNRHVNKMVLGMWDVGVEMFDSKSNISYSIFLN